MSGFERDFELDRSERERKLVDRAGHVHGYAYMVEASDTIAYDLSDDEVNSVADIVRKRAALGRIPEDYTDEFQEGFSRGFYNALEDEKHEKKGTTWLP